MRKIPVDPFPNEWTDHGGSVLGCASESVAGLDRRIKVDDSEAECDQPFTLILPLDPGLASTYGVVEGGAASEYHTGEQLFFL
jgi:hypothetical protein